MVHSRPRIRNCQRGEFGDRAAAYFHRQALWTQAPFAANRTWRRGHILADPFAIIVRTRFFQTTFEKADYALKVQARKRFRGTRALSAGSATIVLRPKIRRRIAVQNQVLHLARKFLERRRKIESVRDGAQLQAVFHKHATRTGPQTTLQ